MILTLVAGQVEVNPGALSLIETHLLELTLFGPAYVTRQSH